MAAQLDYIAGRVWRIYANIVGILFVSTVIAYAIIWTGSPKGPVVHVIAGPDPALVVKVVEGGILGYTLTSERLLSCPGTVTGKFQQRDARGRPTLTILYPRPVPSTDLRPAGKSRTEWILPDNIGPGRWHFDSILDSTCPTGSRLDVLASFDFEVVPPEGPK